MKAFACGWVVLLVLALALPGIAAQPEGWTESLYFDTGGLPDDLMELVFSAPLAEGETPLSFMLTIEKAADPQFFYDPRTYRLEVFHPGETSPLDSFAFEAEVPLPRMLYALADVNFDGWRDWVIILREGMANKAYGFYLWQPDDNRFAPVDSDIPDIMDYSLYPKGQVIHTGWRESAMTHVQQLLRFEDGRLVRWREISVLMDYESDDFVFYVTRAEYAQGEAKTLEQYLLEGDELDANYQRIWDDLEAFLFEGIDRSVQDVKP